MKIYLMPKLLILPSFVLSISLWATPGPRAADQLVEGAMILAPREEFGDVVPKTVGDTLKACLAKIPALSTGGQRLLAEQSCQEEEAMRRSDARASKF